MRASTLVELGIFAALAGCSSRQTTIGSSLGEPPHQAVATASPSSSASVAGAAPRSPLPPALANNSTEPVPPPPPDPALVKALVEKTGETSGAANDNPLHLRLEVSPQPAGELWLVAVVNRGTEPARVLFDLRQLTLTLTPPEGEKKPGRWQKKPATVVCRLPEGFGGRLPEEAPRTLQPGEGLVQTFDPRLYCISPSGESRLATGQRVTPKLGFEPKPPRVVWKQGKRSEVPSQQVAPFIAEPLTQPSEAPEPERDPHLKQLVGSELLLTREMTDAEAEEDTSLPLQLRLVRGSDAVNELSATAVVEVRARKKSLLYFRRELVSYIVHGPDGIRGCDPQPDDRAPDRQAYSTLAPGRSLSATSLLTELCPKYTFGRPGLYLVSARLDAERTGAEFGLSAFTGRLESAREALIRIRVGDLPALPPPEPVRVKVGQ